MNPDRFEIVLDYLKQEGCKHLLTLGPNGLAELARAFNGWWSVYIIQSARDGSLYTGIALDVEQRVKVHHLGAGAKRTRGRGPWKLVWAKVVTSHSSALRTEARIKKLSRQRKLRLIEGHLTLDDLAAEDNLKRPKVYL